MADMLSLRLRCDVFPSVGHASLRATRCVCSCLAPAVASGLKAPPPPRGSPLPRCGARARAPRFLTSIRGRCGDSRPSWTPPPHAAELEETRARRIRQLLQGGRRTGGRAPGVLSRLPCRAPSRGSAHSGAVGREPPCARLECPDPPPDRWASLPQCLGGHGALAPQLPGDKFRRSGFTHPGLGWAIAPHRWHARSADADEVISVAHVRLRPALSNTLARIRGALAGAHRDSKPLLAEPADDIHTDFRDAARAFHRAGRRVSRRHGGARDSESSFGDANADHLDIRALL